MLAYILKRILLMLPTLLGVLLLTFVVIQFVPGGPVEQYMAEAKAGMAGGGGAEACGDARHHRGARRQHLLPLAIELGLHQVLAGLECRVEFLAAHR